MQPVLIAFAVFAVGAYATASFAEEPEVEVLSQEEENDDRHHHDWRQRLLRGAGKIRDAINGAVGSVRVPDQRGRTWSSSNVTADFGINAPRIDIRVLDHSLAILGSTSVSGIIFGNYKPRFGRQTPFIGNGKLAFELRFRFREGRRRVEVFAVQGTAAFNKLQIVPGPHPRCSISFGWDCGSCVCYLREECQTIFCVSNFSDFESEINFASATAFTDTAGKAAFDEIKKIINS